MNVRVGTSGWQYADWRDVLYPAGLPSRLWLETYASSFDTVEVNSTFYRLPNADAVRRWTEAVRPGFVFEVKASRYLTHIKRLREPEEPVDRLMARIEPLRAAAMLGPVLVQLPPDMKAAPAALDATLARFPDDVRVAVEPRHATWFDDTTRAVLEKHQAALVWADRDGESLGPLWTTAPWCYLRLHHGRDEWSYADDDLRRWADRVGEVGNGYVFTNNDPGGAAVHDARHIRELLTARQPV